MLLDELMPHFDATRVEHRVVEGGSRDVYEAVRRADFMRYWRVVSPMVGMVLRAQLSEVTEEEARSAVTTA